MITICVPPILPAAMTAGVSIALNWLRTFGIQCISPTWMNVAGWISIMVFDKTGTLTEEGLSLHGYLPVLKDKSSKTDFINLY